jgi:hypothetical protein
MSFSPSDPLIQVIDNNGSPIVGAVLRVYEAGTTTNRAIYSDIPSTAKSRPQAAMKCSRWGCGY